jgi:4-amino-4-deoxy-L-arabinose transferase-like glycosyltransferase
LFLAGLGRAGLNDPDEGRNAEVAREMLVASDWVTPRINDARYLDKPPLFFWAVAASYRLLGVNETAARLPSALSALAALGITVWFVRRRIGARAGLVAGVLLAISPIYLVFARLVIFDMMLLLCTTASIVASFEAMEGDGRGRAAPAVAFLAAGAGTLVKGPVALLVPLLVAAAWSLVRRRPSLLLRLRWGQGLLLYLAVVAPWAWLVEARNPGFLRYALLGENLARMAANPYDTQRPIHFYLKVIAPGAFPAIVLCLAQGVRAVVRRARRGLPAPAGAGPAPGARMMPASAPLTPASAPPTPADLATRYAAVWLAVMLLFFSLIAGKRPSYILPCAVPVAILAARLIVRACHGRDEDAPAAPDVAARGDLVWGTAIVGGLCLLGAAAALFVDPALGSGLVRHGRHAALLSQSGLFRLTAGALLAAAVTVVLAGRARRAGVVVAALSLPLLAMLPLARGAAKEIEATRSSRGLSRFLEARMTPQDRVICFEEYRPGLNFYLRRPIFQVTRAGRIFTSNYIEAHLDQFRQDPGFRLLPKERLREMLSDPASTAYVLADSKEFGPLFEAAGLPLRPVWEQGGFGLFVRDGAPRSDTEPPAVAEPASERVPAAAGAPAAAPAAAPAGG